MHNLAIALQNNGHTVTGSDDEIFEPSRSRLLEKGLLPEKEGWSPDKITTDIDAIILGMHAKPANPELLKAQELKLKIYSYPEFLYEKSKDKVRVVIGGSHGKTTITAMIMHVLKDTGHPFDYLVGSKIKGFDVMVNISKESMLMIFEGDEYLSSPIDRRPKFHWYKPNIALLSGIAWDHINVFPTRQDYNKQFSIFIDLMQKGGTLIYNRDDAELKTIVENGRKDIERIQYCVPEFEIVDGITRIVMDGKITPLKIFGKHNLMNLEGAMLVCKSIGIDESQFCKSIAGFEGASNRLELLESTGGKKVFKDFAHAPSKVRATVEAVREQYPDHHFVACLELHTFSSLNKDFIDQYFGSLDLADNACVYYNPHALMMKNLPDLNNENLRQAFGNEKLAIFADSKKMKEWLMQPVMENTVYLLMSSGNFDGINLNQLAEQLI